MIEINDSNPTGLVFNGTSFVPVESLNRNDLDLNSLIEQTKQKIEDLGAGKEVAKLKAQLTAGLGAIIPPADSAEE